MGFKENSYIEQKSEQNNKMWKGNGQKNAK
jgi:hypothetical protein